MSGRDLRAETEALCLEADVCARAIHQLTPDGWLGSADPIAGWILTYLAAGATVSERGAWAVLTRPDGARLVVPLRLAQQVIQA
jgi:hypothetical protein